MSINETELPKAIFVVNPMSGHKRWEKTLKEIKAAAAGRLDYELLLWEKPEQRNDIIQKIKEGAYHYAIAAGGDGTVNMIAEAVLHSETCLGILPMGSGNGLARHLGIPFGTAEAIDLLLKGEQVEIDCGWINGMHFVCTCGVGFDAHIGKLFAGSSKRGFSTYARITLQELARYRPQRYRFFINGRSFRRKAFLITFANICQYGNNVYIAPFARVNDGLLDVCILKPFKWQQIPELAWRLFTKKIELSRLYQRILTDEVLLERVKPGPVHFDGEPAEMGPLVRVKVLPKAIKIMAGKNFSG